MTRPRIMYIVAAKRAGEIRMSDPWTTKGMR
jgi:hypothetical protein